MLFRSCAGGVVFHKDTVLLLQNEKGEWVFPKGLIRPGLLAHEVAVGRVKAEAGVVAVVLSVAGQTSYEFYSITRQKPVCNEVSWFIMRTGEDSFHVNTQEGFRSGGFFPVTEALQKITYSQDKALLRTAFEKYKKL